MTDLRRRTDEALVRMDDFCYHMRNSDADDKMMARSIDYVLNITRDVLSSTKDEELYNKIKYLVKTFDKQCKDLAVMARGKKESDVINTMLNIICMSYVKNVLKEVLDDEDEKENKNND